MAADYDLNEIADALALRWNGLTTVEYDGVDRPMTALSEVVGSVQPPAIVLELDDIDWDLTMGRGSDTFTFLAYLIVATADSVSGQRLVRQLMSTGGAAGRLKDAMDGVNVDRTLGGLVSIVHMPSPRSVGRINYSGVDYLGAILPIEVTAQ
jgi:hypothetical protein